MVRFHCILSTLVAFYHSQTLVRGDGFDSFVFNKIREYPEWIRANNLDPSPPMTTGFNLQGSGLIFKFDTSISNMVVRGLDTSYQASNVETDLAAGSFSLSVYTGPQIFSGNHKSNGSIATTPINQAGHWNITVDWSYLQFTIQFEVLPSGYLNLTSTVPGDVTLPPLPIELYFEGLTDNEAGYEGIVFRTLYKKFQNYMGLDTEAGLNPVRSTFHRYWKEVLDKTTLADLICTTDLSTTSPPTTGIPVTRPPTTNAPCAEVLKTERNTYSEEEVLDRREGVDAYGNPVIVTRMIVVKHEPRQL